MKQFLDFFKLYKTEFLFHRIIQTERNKAVLSLNIPPLLLLVYTKNINYKLKKQL